MTEKLFKTDEEQALADRQAAAERLRDEAASHFYRVNPSATSEDFARLWPKLRDEIYMREFETRDRIKTYLDSRYGDVGKRLEAERQRQREEQKRISSAAPRSAIIASATKTRNDP